MYTQTSVLFNILLTLAQSLPFRETELSKNFTNFLSEATERVYFETKDIHFGCVDSGLDTIFQAKCKWLHDYHEGIENNQCIFSKNNASVEKVDDFLSTLSNECGYTTGNYRAAMENSLGSSIYDTLQGYGCWCSTATDFQAGRGPVQNNIHKQCKDLTESLKCLQIDISEEECPHDFTGHYVAMSPLNFGMDIEEQCVFVNDIINTCDGRWTENQLKCAKKRCIVEANMVMFLVGLGLDENHRFNADLIHTEYDGDFNFEDTCLTGTWGKTPTLEEPTCCGEYPKRFPIYKENQGCCSGRRYNKLKLECCDNNDDDVFNLVSLSTCLGEVVD